MYTKVPAVRVRRCAGSCIHISVRRGVSLFSWKRSDELTDQRLAVNQTTERR